MSYGLRDATVRFGRTTAVSDVSVAVAPGAVVAVVGGDGAGKTTLLRAVVGEVALDAGQRSVPAIEQVGYLPAGSGSWAALTVRQNLDFVAGVYGVTGDALTERRTGLLARTGLTDAADRPAAHLSGGMRRKLGFAMAILHRPRLLVLDEPSTGVDPVSRMELWRLITHAAADGTAVLLTTTYLDEAERAAGLIVLDRGRTLAAGRWDTIRAEFPGTVTAGPSAHRPEWSWRRGKVVHEYWPDTLPAAGTEITPDLEDVVIALALHRRGAA